MRWPFFSRRARLRDRDAEMRAHLALLRDQLIARGLSPDAGRRQARLQFGNPRAKLEEVAALSRLPLIDGLGRDLRAAIRSLRATPSFTLVALVVLALGIGASAAIYSIVDAVLLRPLPFDEPDQLVAVAERFPSSGRIENATPQNFLDWRARQDVFTGLAAIAPGRNVALSRQAGAEPEILPTENVTAEFFDVLRVPPIRGRVLTRADEVATRAPAAVPAVISYRLWQRRFGGAEDVLGKILPGQVRALTIVGVLPASFEHPVGDPSPTDIWIPYVPEDSERVRANEFGRYLQLVGRLRPGVSVAEAQTRMDQITAGMAAETPRWFDDLRVHVESLQRFQTAGVRTWMWLLLSAVGCLLLIACVNIGTLMLVRASSRLRELAIRTALGATRRDLARALVTESLLLSIAGATLGVGLAAAGTRVLRASLPPELPRIATIAVDTRVLTMMAVVAVIAGVAFGLAPLSLRRGMQAGVLADTAARGQTSGRGQQRLRSVLVSIEVGLAAVLLVGAGLFLWSFARVISVPLGLNPHNVFVVQMRPTNYALVADAAAKAAVIQRNQQRFSDVLGRVQRLPGVQSAALVGAGLPLTGSLVTRDFGVPGRVLPAGTNIDLNPISSDYFRVISVPLLRGRMFSPDDRGGSEPVAMLNASAAARYFPGAEAVGQFVEIDHQPRRVVGVVGDIRHEGPETDWRQQAFIPFDQMRQAGTRLVVRVGGGAGSPVAAIKTAVWTEFPELAIPQMETLDGYLGSLLAQRRLNMLLLTIFGAFGLVIAAVGIYGVMAYVVFERTREIGIRLALGAQPTTVRRAVLARAGVQLGAGLTIGLGAAWMLAGLTRSFLFAVTPHDPLIFAGVPLVLVLAGLLAAWIPARRASRVDPLIALRAE